MQTVPKDKPLDEVRGKYVRKDKTVQVPFNFKKAPKTLAAAEQFGLSTPLTLKKPTDAEAQKKESQLLQEEAVVPETDDLVNLNEDEDNLDKLDEYEAEYSIDPPHRYSKDRKDVNGFFRFAPSIEDLFFKPGFLNFLFITFYSVLNSNRLICLSMFFI